MVNRQGKHAFYVKIWHNFPKIVTLNESILDSKSSFLGELWIGNSFFQKNPFILSHNFWKIMSYFHIKCVFTLPLNQFFGLFYPINYKMMLKKELIQWIVILFLNSKKNQESTVRENSRIVPTLPRIYLSFHRERTNQESWRTVKSHQQMTRVNNRLKGP